MDDSKALFDYWHDLVRLKNYELIAAPGHVQTQDLRHECTNYDDLWRRPAVQQLSEPERSRVVAIIKYECTAQVLQNRAGRLRDRANELAAASHEQDQQKSKLLGLIKALQEKLFALNLGRSIVTMKLQELKTKVYELAGVDTTKQLKAKYEEIKTLDMRRQTSWEKTLAILQKQQSEFEEWLENPPEEYKDLFSEITEASQKYDQKSTETKQQVREVLSIANNLEELAEECQDEAAQLKQEVEISRRMSKQARLN